MSLRREGFDDEYIFSHKPSFKWLDMKRFKEADLIIGMSKAHKMLTPLCYQKKYINMSEFAGEGYKAVPDPFLMKDINDYYAVMDTLKALLIKGLERIENGEI